MNLISFSIKTKGLRNFARRLWTVFSRFGFSETRAQRNLRAIADALLPYNSAPTFFIPAAIMQRHPRLCQKLVEQGVEMGVHGYYHNDYRSLTAREQQEQTALAASTFDATPLSWKGFRNPYLGWTEELVPILDNLNFDYESNETTLHNVVDLSRIPMAYHEGYKKSLALYRPLPLNASTVLPHIEGTLVRIPLSIPDDEMLVDRLRITSGTEVGAAWSAVMQRVYELGGIYVLNLHPERGTLCREALNILLKYASNQPLPVWITRLEDAAQWWREREAFQLEIHEAGEGWWRIVAHSTERATLLARNVPLDTLQDEAQSWYEDELRVLAQEFTLETRKAPCIALSPRTHRDVATFLHGQGYHCVTAAEDETDRYALYLDEPRGLGEARPERALAQGKLLLEIEKCSAPLVYFGAWPDGRRAALSITGDADSITIQDFFLRILEVSKSGKQ